MGKTRDYVAQRLRLSFPEKIKELVSRDIINVSVAEIQNLEKKREEVTESILASENESRAVQVSLGEA